MKKFAKMAVAAAIVGFSFAASANVVIDDFSVGQGLSGVNLLLNDTTSNGSGFWNSATGATSSILGGERDMFVEKLGNGNISSVNTYVDGGTLFYSTASGSYGRSILKWDGINGSSAVSTGSEASYLSTLNKSGLGGYDLAATGNAFVISVYNSDIGFDFSLTAYSATDTNKWTTLVLASQSHVNGVPGDQPIDFADFYSATANESFNVLGSGALRFTGSSGGVDLSDLGAILATVNWSGGTGKVDLEIVKFSTVPEPESLALVGLGLLGLAASRRRKTA